MAAGGGSAAQWGVLIVRVALGVVLLLAGLHYVTTGADASLVERTAARIADAPAAYAWFGENVVLRFPTAFAFLLVWGLVAAGGALVVGALVRPASAGVMFLALNFYLAGPSARAGEALLLALCALACLVARAGEFVGLDFWLAKWLPRWLTWQR
jgi:uncharacterized membrane protein YphA (DoxX/SURF4 family)